MYKEEGLLDKFALEAMNWEYVSPSEEASRMTVEESKAKRRNRRFVDEDELEQLIMKESSSYKLNVIKGARFLQIAIDAIAAKVAEQATKCGLQPAPSEVASSVADDARSEAQSSVSMKIEHTLTSCSLLYGTTNWIL